MGAAAAAGATDVTSAAPGRLRRPRGAPKASNPAVLSFLLLWAATPWMGLLVITVWNKWDFGVYFGAMGWNFLIGCLGVVIVVLLNLGHLYAVALFRYVGFALAVAAVAIALCAAAMLAEGGLPGADRDAAQFILIFSAFMVPMAAILVRGLLRVRWLDPASKPSEWEPQPLRD